MLRRFPKLSDRKLLEFRTLSEGSSQRSSCGELPPHITGYRTSSLMWSSAASTVAATSESVFPVPGLIFSAARACSTMSIRCSYVWLMTTPSEITPVANLSECLAVEFKMSIRRLSVILRLNSRHRGLFHFWTRSCVKRRSTAGRQAAFAPGEWSTTTLDALTPLWTRLVKTSTSTR